MRNSWTGIDPRIVHPLDRVPTPARPTGSAQTPISQHQPGGMDQIMPTDITATGWPPHASHWGRRQMRQHVLRALEAQRSKRRHPPGSPSRTWLTRPVQARSWYPGKALCSQSPGWRVARRRSTARRVRSIHQHPGQPVACPAMNRLDAYCRCAEPRGQRWPVTSGSTGDPSPPPGRWLAIPARTRSAIEQDGLEIMRPDVPRHPR